MADPVRGSLMDELRRDQMHSRDILAALGFLREALDREQIPFGLIGALALRHYGYHRFTEDIDILTTPEGLDKIHENVVGRGLLPRAPGLRKKLRQTQHKVNIDVVMSGEHAGSNESPITFPSPESEGFVEREGLRVVTLEKLVELKIASGVWGQRDQDLVDVQRLIQANGLDESFSPKLPEALRAKYLKLLERARGEVDIE
jgi:nucleotidyltransferase AbiEii toxin of type IV toxin-antitoxin system